MEVHGKIGERMELPEECIANILSHTTPADACRLSVVSKLFHSAAESDAVWGRFIPSDVVFNTSQSDSQPSLLANSPSEKCTATRPEHVFLGHLSHTVENGEYVIDFKWFDENYGWLKVLKYFYLISPHNSCDKFVSNVFAGAEKYFPSKKALYLALSDHPIINNQGDMSFQLDRKSGKKCYMLGAKALTITWGDTTPYWNFITLPESRFPEVAQLGDVFQFTICQVINTLALSPNTQYAAYLMFKMIEAYGFENLPVKLSIGIVGGETSTKYVYLVPNLEGRQHNRAVAVGLQSPNVRSDGWLEIEMGSFFNTGIEDEKVQMIDIVLEIKSSNLKCGLTIEGIEVRPKEDN